MIQVPAAILDTDVFSLVYVTRKAQDPRVAAWRVLLRERRVLIAFQTRAEVLEGALERGWGPRRMQATRQVLNETPTIPPDDTAIDAYAELTAACRRAGHALRDRRHTADRWVAACAIATGIPLLSGDAIYRNAPNLTLLN